MVWFDIVIGLILLLEIFKGLKKGFLGEIGTILGIFFGFFIASASGNTMAGFLSPVCGDSAKWSAVLGFLLTFLVVFSLIVILAKIFEGFLSVLALGWVNRLAGGFFCLLKGALVLSIVLNLYQAIDEDRSMLGPERIESSAFYKPIVKVAPALFPSFRLFHHSDTTLTKNPKQIMV
jgi:membrane protein required for colicin V production